MKDLFRVNNFGNIALQVTMNPWMLMKRTKTVLLMITKIIPRKVAGKEVKKMVSHCSLLRWIILTCL
jgi:hypothetical protein